MVGGLRTASRADFDITNSFPLLLSNRLFLFLFVAFSSPSIPLRTQTAKQTTYFGILNYLFFESFASLCNKSTSFQSPWASKFHGVSILWRQFCRLNSFNYCTQEKSLREKKKNRKLKVISCFFCCRLFVCLFVLFHS
eukprot:TRINITY_DN4767_c5_g1_i1.p1 TRINITY_DN4767_c5_g1~~TRINITY_DN4767_c5_g1_i1.p1  ORF type:complete len:138 (+),score=7.34 TRINITY_DN4767_c5_g1_i1:350-763(+)